MGTEFLDIGIANIAREFAPQWVPVVRKLHLPKSCQLGGRRSRCNGPRHVAGQNINSESIC